MVTTASNVVLEESHVLYMCWGERFVKGSGTHMDATQFTQYLVLILNYEIM